MFYIRKCSRNARSGVGVHGFSADILPEDRKIAVMYDSKLYQEGIVTGLVLSGIVIGLLVPNMTGRVALYCALCYGIYMALKIPNNSNTGAGIMFAGFVAAIAPSWLYLSASENLQLVNSYLKETGNRCELD